MAERSMFAPGGNGMTRGGLDRYLGPGADGESSLPASITDKENAAEPPIAVDCAGADKDQAVCQIAAAEKAHDRPVT